MSMEFRDYERVQEMIAEAIRSERARLSAIISACPVAYDYDYSDGTCRVDVKGTLGRIVEAMDALPSDHEERMQEQGEHALGSYDETQEDTWVAWFKWRKIR